MRDNLIKLLKDLDLSQDFWSFNVKAKYYASKKAFNDLRFNKDVVSYLEFTSMLNSENKKDVLLAELWRKIFIEFLIYSHEQ